jgi:hypothetical protein
MAKLLREYVSDLSYDRELIKESAGQGKPILLNALLQKADELNQNGRVYPREILFREVENYKKAVAEQRASGELDHPDSSVVSLQNVSHAVRDIWWDGDNVMGKVEILPALPMGKIALGLIESGIKIGISSRGVGDTMKNEQGHDVVDESFMLVAFDLVSEPSTHEAWLSEGKDLSLAKIRELVPKVDRINRIVNEILRK